MIPIIGLVICGYVFVRMIELLLQTRSSLLQVCTALMCVGSMVAAGLIINASVQASKAEDAAQGAFREERPAYP